MKVSVEPRHIKVGRPRSFQSCPVALAIKEVVDNDVRVFGRYVSVNDNYSVDLGREVARFVDLFDEWEKATPRKAITFELPPLRWKKNGRVAKEQWKMKEK